MESGSFRHIASLGSSFAAEPGIEPLANRAAMRSARNYPHLLAERLGADLSDLTVSGATTGTILDTPQRMRGHVFPPQSPGTPRRRRPCHGDGRGQRPRAAAGMRGVTGAILDHLGL